MVLSPGEQRQLDRIEQRLGGDRRFAAWMTGRGARTAIRRQAERLRGWAGSARACPARPSGAIAAAMAIAAADLDTTAVLGAGPAAEWLGLPGQGSQHY